MASPLSNVLTITLIPVTATIIGAAIAAFQTLGPRLRSFVQHFAAGVVFVAAAGEVLPDIAHEKSPIAVIIGGALGVVLMLVVKQLTEKASGFTSLIVTVGVDIIIDGLVIGIGFTAGAKEGILLTIALTIELLFLSLSVALSQTNASRVRVIMTTAGLALLLPLGAVVSTTLLVGLPGSALAALLAFGLVALLYLVTEELLVEVHELPDNSNILCGVLAVNRNRGDDTIG